MTAKFTPTEQRILDLLADGGMHTREEMYSCLDDDLASPTAIRFHLSNMRKKLNPSGYDISCAERNGGAYRLVQTLSSPYSGTR